MTLQDRNPSAKAYAGDTLYDVSVTIPDIGGSDPQEAAEVFWRVLEEYRQGLGPIFIDVEGPDKDFVGIEHFTIRLDPITGEAER